jgi:hypothetical protein
LRRSLNQKHQLQTTPRGLSYAIGHEEFPSPCLLPSHDRLSALPIGRTDQFPSPKSPSRFQRKDLNGWKETCSIGPCRTADRRKNSAENAPKASTYLHTEKKFRAFRLVFEGKLVASEMHSGVALWGQPVEKEGDPHSYTGHLVMFPSAWGFWDLYRRNSIYQDDGRAKAAANSTIGIKWKSSRNRRAFVSWSTARPSPIGVIQSRNSVAKVRSACNFTQTMSRKRCNSAD